MDFAPVNKRHRCEEVPGDAQRRPVFYVKLGPSLQVYDLGKIVWNHPNFHTKKYIWCEIADDGQAPEFRLMPEDDQNNPVSQWWGYVQQQFGPWL